jgi:lysophospholipid acyltransferase (LPLAT)-like uncharacterized protein
MEKKWNIIRQKMNWSDLEIVRNFRGKSKQLLRKFAYSALTQKIICLIICAYILFVYATSRKVFNNKNMWKPFFEKKESLIFASWHNRVMMIPAAMRGIISYGKKRRTGFTFLGLASKHGDGRFVSGVLENFGFVIIAGSTKDKRKSRGIDIGGLRQILSGLKKSYFMGFTPDGPRGPNQKINGELINIARLSGAKIVPLSYSTSRFIELNSWDRFKIPLPFSTICFYYDDAISVPKDADEKEMEKIKLYVEERMNFAQEKSLELAISK